MAWRDWGNKPVHSTTAQPVANPSTATLIAEIDSTQLGTNNFAVGQSQLYMVTWLLGADTSATFQCELANSTTLATAPAAAGPVLPGSMVVKTPSGQSGQYMTVLDVPKDGRLRVHLNSTFTGSAVVFITAEPLT